MIRTKHFAAAILTWLFAASLAQAAPATAPSTSTAPKSQGPADVPSVMHPTGEAHLRKIHDRFMQRIKDDNKIDLLFIGDSITANWGTYGKDVWKQYYGKYDAANFGDGGDYTQHLLWRIDNGELDGIHPKVVVLLIGINNLYHGPGNNAVETAGGIKKILDTVHEKLPDSKVILMGLFPYRGVESVPRKACVAVNEIISKFDDGNKTRYLGLWDQFLQPDKTISKEIMSDGLHPTAKGYEIWAQNMQPLLDEMMK